MEDKRGGHVRNPSAPKPPRANRIPDPPSVERNRVFTLILAGNYQHAMICAKFLNLRFPDWKYVSMEQTLMAYSPGAGVRVVAYETAPNALRIAARRRGFEVWDASEITWKSGT